MVNKEHLDIFDRGVGAWNAWRRQNPDETPMLSGGGYDGRDLRGYDLSKTNLNAARLIHCDLRGANLSESNLGHANLRSARLKEASLQRADLSDTRLSWADLRLADLSKADLRWADLTRSNLAFANLKEALLLGTTFADTDLSCIRDSESCKHLGTSFVDHLTFQRSDSVPMKFWICCGLTDQLIEYLPSLTRDAIRTSSCFISHSSNEQDFAERLHSDLIKNSVKCKLATHDFPIGSKILDEIDKAVQTSDKVLLILSEASIASDWVEDEVTKAFAEERERQRLVLFPVRVDDAVMKTNEPWARKLRDGRNIGDFTRWKEYAAYRETLRRVLSDLRKEA